MQWQILGALYIAVDSTVPSQHSSWVFLYFLLIRKDVPKPFKDKNFIGRSILVRELVYIGIIHGWDNKKHNFCDACSNQMDSKFGLLRARSAPNS